MANANFDGDIAVSIQLTGPPRSKTDFGVLALAVSATGAGFTEKSRTYETPADVDADTDITTAQAAALKAAFNQPLERLKPKKLMVVKVDTVTANVWDVQITAAGDDGDEHTINLLGTAYTHAKTVGQNPADVIDALIALIAAGSEPVTLTDNGDTVRITGTNLGQALGVTYGQTGNAAGTASEITNEVDYGEAFNTLVAEVDNFYGLHLESRAAFAIKSLAAAVELRGDKLLIVQSSDADILTSASDDVFSSLKGNNYKQTVGMYCSDDTKWNAFVWAANRLSVNPDNASTTWKGVTIQGDATKQEAITTTEKTNILAKRGNVNLTQYDTGHIGDGYAMSGHHVDTIVMKNWLETRVKERVARHFSERVNAGSKVEYDDGGIQGIAAVTREILIQGENAGHFVDGSSAVSVPKRKDISSATLATRQLSYSFGAQESGAIEGAQIAGYVTVDFAGFA